MDQLLNEIRESQKNTWNKFSAGWKKWDDFTMNFLKPMGDTIVSALDIQTEDEILDVACGTGEPGLTIAALAHKGKVTGTDLAAQMLAIAKENAGRKELINYYVQLCDVCELPFEAKTFDKISCRMGFMFFPDMQLASDEMYRVLKPGGLIATSVWSIPDKNAWVTTIMAAISNNTEVPAPPPGSPGMFRCGSAGFIKNIMVASGFKNVHEQEVNGKVVYSNFDDMWTMMNEVAAPVVGALSKMDAALKEKVKNEARLLSKKFETSRGLEMDYGSLVISAGK